MLSLVVVLCVSAAVHPTRSSHLEADFKMSRTASSPVMPQVQFGHFVYKATGAVQLVYENGVEETVPDELVRFVNRFLGSETIRNCIEYKVETGNDMVTLYPRRRAVKQWFKEMQVFFNPLTGFVREVVMTEPTDDVTTVEFFNIESK